MSAANRVPPAWVISIPNATFGMVIGFIIVTMPQILSARGIAGGQIAEAISVITIPTFLSFLIAPILDVRFRRRTYATVFGLIGVSGTAFTVFYHPSKAEIVVVMFAAALSIALFGSALGGWTGALVDKQNHSKLGSWMTIFNICGGGLGIFISGWLVQHLSPLHAAELVLVIFLAPMLVFFIIPAPAADSRLASESFGRFGRDIAALFERREVLVALAMFILPSASFAMTNTLGGWGKYFDTSPGIVTDYTFLGSIVAGVIGSFLVPVIAKKLALRRMYLAIGVIGACFTLSMLLLPRTSTTFGLVFLGESMFQAAAFATAFAVVYDVIGKGNPLAATIFAVLIGSMNLPIIYMEYIDGLAFDWRGVVGAFTVDALLSGGVCVLLWIVLFHVLKVQRMRPTTQPEVAPETG